MSYTPTDIQAIVSVLPERYARYFYQTPLAKDSTLAITIEQELFVLAASVWSLETLGDGELDEFAASVLLKPGEISASAVFSIFAEFDDPQPNPLQFVQMRRVWLRRMAVCLWADVHGHWPWSILDEGMDAHAWTVLFGWSPEPDLIDQLPPLLEQGADFTLKSGDWLFESSDPLPGLRQTQPKSFSGKNGQNIFSAPDGLYHFSQVWDANPLVAWAIAWSSVRPLLGSQSRLPDDVAPSSKWSEIDGAWKPVPESERLSAFLALRDSLSRVGYQHPQFFAAGTANGPTLWPSFGKYPPHYCLQVVPTYDACPWTTVTLADVWRARAGGCTQTSALGVSVLRAMNIASHVVCTSIFPRTHIWDPPVMAKNAGETRTIDVNSVLAWYQADPVNHRMWARNHHTMVSDSGVADVGLFHADDLCCYKGLRFAHPGLFWVPRTWILQILGAGLLYQWAADLILDEEGAESAIAFIADQIWVFQSYLAFRENQSMAVLAGLAGMDDTWMKAWADWQGGYEFVMHAALPTVSAVDGSPDVTNASWFARWAKGPEGPANSILNAAALFFELDARIEYYQSIQLFKSGMGGVPWGQGRFPVNFYGRGELGKPSYGLAADSKAQQYLSAIMLKAGDLFS